MKRKLYLLDTHALIFWQNQESVSQDFIRYFDKQDQLGNLLVSSISFWETALLTKKGKLEIKDIESWKNELLANTNLVLINPSESEMIQSVHLPDFHKDPFDQLLIIQANKNGAVLVSKDENIQKYSVPVYWI